MITATAAGLRKRNRYRETKREKKRKIYVFTSLSVPTIRDSLLLSSLEVGAIEKEQKRLCACAISRNSRYLFGFFNVSVEIISEVSLSALNIHEYTPCRRAPCQCGGTFSLALVLLLIILFIFIFVWLWEFNLFALSLSFEFSPIWYFERHAIFKIVSIFCSLCASESAKKYQTKREEAKNERENVYRWWLRLKIHRRRTEEEKKSIAFAAFFWFVDYDFSGSMA